MKPLPRESLTEAQYLIMEPQSATRHEFVNGEAWAKPGASPRHALIQGGLMIALGTRLKGQGRPCRALGSDARVHIPSTSAYVYPDLTVVCGPFEYSETDRHSITNPSAIFEVLSDSTEDFDRGAKFDHYRRIPTLREYVLVSQKRPRILHFQRTEDDRWLMGEPSGLDATLDLSALGCTVPLAEIYDGYEEARGDEAVVTP